ncbi:MAG TPA: JAB domain-containing protein [Chloroflexota bacterium]|nr:JAB domain-containing protein [Chloroflexota bacterium]
MTPRRASKQQPAARDEIETVIELVRQNLRLLGELVQRYEVDRTGITADGRIVRKPADVIGYLGPEMADLAQEQLRVVLLDTKNRLLGASLVYQGGINSIMVRLADCFREAVRVNAAAILLVHNHPSGDPEPSSEDVRVTREAAQVGELLGIDLLDHVIVGGRAHVSLRERGFYRPVMEQQSGRRRKSAGGETPSWEVAHA